MKKTHITVTEAARNFADCVNRAHYQKASFVLVKNGQPFACLVPGDEKVCTGQNLADALAGVQLPKSESRAWSRDLRRARRKLQAPGDKWR